MPGDYDLGTARGRIELDASSLYRSAAALRSVGLGLISVGTVAVAGLAVAVNAAANFEQKMSAVQAVLGATDEEMKKAKATALELGANSVYGATQVAAAMEDLAKAGLTINEIVGGAAQATIAVAQASGGLIKLDRAGEIVANTMRTFGLEAKDATHIADLLAGAANASTLEIEDLAVSMRYVGPVAHAAGISLDSLNTALAVLGDRGIRGSTAGTSLRGVMLGIISPSTKAAKVMKELGLITEDGGNIFFDSSGKMKDFAQVAQILQDHTKGLTREQKEAAFATIFQRRAMASALVLADQGAAGFAKYADSIDRVSAADVAAKKLDNLKGDVQLLKSALETALIKAGTPFQNFLRTIVQSITKVVQAFGRLNPTIQTWILSLSAGAGAMAIFAGGILLILSKLFIMYRAFKDLQQAIAILRASWVLLNATFAITPIGAIIVGILALIAAVILIWKNWDKIWNFIAHHKALALVIALLAPFIAILIAVVGAVKYLYENWDTIWPKIQAVFQAVVETIISAWGGLINFFRTSWQAIQQIFQAAWGVIEPVLQGIADFFSTQLIDPIQRFFDFLGRQLGMFGRYFNKNIMPTLQAFGDLFAAVFDRATETVDAMWSFTRPILEYLGRVFGTLLKGEIEVFRVAIAGLLPVVQSVFAIISSVVTTFAGVVKAIWEPIWQGIQLVVAGALESIQAAFTIFMAVVKAVWGPFWGLVGDVIKRVWDFIKEYVDAAMLFVRGIIETITGLISGDWGKAWEGIRNIFAGIWDSIVAMLRLFVGLMRDTIVRGFDAILNFFRGVPSAVQNALGNLLGVLVDRGTDLIKGLWNGIQNFWLEVLGFFWDLPGKILEAIGDLGSLLFDIGKALIQGLIDGISSMFDPVKNVLGSLTDKLTGWKGPPSRDKKLLVENGQLIMQSLIDGLADGIPGLKATLEGVTKIIEQTTPLASSGLNAGATAAAATVPANVIAGNRPTATVPSSTVNEGDTFHLEAITTADPRDIADELFFGKKLRSL